MSHARSDARRFLHDSDTVRPLMDMNKTLRFGFSSSHSRALVALLAIAGASLSFGALTACSSGDVPVGSTSQALQKNKSGTPTGDGTSCSWDATTPPSGSYAVGATFKSPDGCNDCSCTAQGVACTLRACAPPPGGSSGGTCSYGGQTYASGASFPSTDGCNTCSCSAAGQVLCTELACAPLPAPGPAACKKTGCSNEICADHDEASPCVFSPTYACYDTATCERQADGQCGFTQTPALQACLAK